MDMKSLFFTLATSICLLSPIIENDWWKPYLGSIADSLESISSPANSTKILNQRAFPYYNKLQTARSKLLSANVQQIAITNQDKAVIQRISEVLYPVKVDHNAKLEIFIDMDTGRLEVKARKVNTRGAK